MNLSIFDNMMKGLNNAFNQVEDFIANHFDNPLLWISIVVMILIISAFAYNSLSK